MSEEQDKTDKQPEKVKADKKAEAKQLSPTGKSAAPDSKTSDSKPGDAASDDSAKKHSTPHHARRKRKSKQHGTSGWLVTSVIVIALLVGAGWYANQQYLSTQKSFNEIQESQAALTRQNREFEAALLKRMQAMQAQQKELTDYIQVLRDKNQHLRKDWLLMEAEYLIQLSNYRLLFERDINTAIAALESADVRLRDTGDPGILSVRKVIAESVQALKQVPQADLAGLSLTLSAINKDIEKLPLSTPDPKSKQNEVSQASEETKHVQSWSELPAAMWRDLKSLVVIRDHEAPIQPLLSPEERFFLIENLRLQIEQARLAMLSGQDNVYKERLTTSIGWIERHFDKESAITKSTLDTLKQMQSESIAPNLPDITKTYHALRNYRLGREPAKQPVQSKPTLPAPSESPVPAEQKLEKPENQKTESQKPESQKPDTQIPDIQTPGAS